MNGLEVEILSALLQPSLVYEPDCSNGSIGSHYAVDPGISTAGLPFSTWVAAPKNLKPLPPANEVTTWEECLFKPMELVT